jgi:hypothetical protein
MHLLYKKLPQSVISFLPWDEWCGKITEIRNNTSSGEAFRKRFYDWFNMFRVVKYLNFTHQELFTKVSANEACHEFIKLAWSVDFKGNEIEMIRYLREKERSF